MSHEKTSLQQRIDSGKPLLLAELTPPQGGDPAPVREFAERCLGKVHAVGITDNRERVSMSALAAAALVAHEGVEPILHIVTRDRNRIALVSEALGAQALGIRNLLCTSGTHQTLGTFRSAKNVSDLDPVQLLQTYAGLTENGAAVGEAAFPGLEPFCLGGVASPFADPLELQIMRLDKKVAAGARFLVTQPVFDLERFEQWWQEVRNCGLQEKVAIVAGVHALIDAEKAKEFAARRPAPRVPVAVLARLAAAPAAAQRDTGIAIAVETIQRLAALKGLRGFQVCGNGDPLAALEVLEKAGIGEK
ncbi:MAG: methylenetetrahydrofolate reductase [Thermoguttaceae bacterium]|jgi:methylenetetrahydrofolate reductase (NADPH)